jgi:malonyl CoA-acyl carrier protein transacylase
MPALTLEESIVAALEDVAQTTGTNLVSVPETRHGHSHGASVAAAAGLAAHADTAAHIAGTVTTLVAKIDLRYAAHS